MVETTMGRRPLALIVLFTIIFDCVNVIHIGNATIESFKNCTLSDLKRINEQHKLKLNQNIANPVDYIFANCEIPIVPNELFINVPNVRSIKFRDANILEIEPFALNGLNDLEVLTIVGNTNLKQLKTYATHNLINLRELNLNNNGIQILDTYALRRYSKLQQLDLDKNNFTQIPVGFFDFSLSIKTLNLARNYLSRIDSYTFKPLLQLIDLNLSHNRISYINLYSFSTTARLESLRLNGNQISTLDSMVFYNLAHLEYLNLSENTLSNKTFEQNIFQQNFNLLNLDISHNAITTFPMNIFSELRALEIFNASHNEIISLPFASVNLKFFDISNNHLTELHDYYFAKMASIEIVNLSRNAINTIEPFTFANLSNLRFLDLSNNRLQSDTFLKNIATLRTINLAHNDFEHLDVKLLNNFGVAVLLNNRWNCSWLIKTKMNTKQFSSPIIIFGLKINNEFIEDIEGPTAEEIECKDFRDSFSDPVTRRIVFISSNDDNKCPKKLDPEKRKNAMISTYPRTFSKILNAEFDYKACLLWSLFAVCLVVGLLRAGRHCFDISERKSEQYRLSLQENLFNDCDNHLTSHKRSQ